MLALALALASTAASATEPSFSADAFKAHVAFLADDLLEGRRIGTAGHEIAARYIAAQFATLGLKPGGDGGTFFQRIRFAETSATSPGAVTISGPNGNRTWADGSNVVLRRNPAHPNPDVSGDLVFVGYGIDDPRHGHDDYRGLDVRGKIVVALANFPKGGPSEPGAYYSGRKRAMAAKHGAVGMITVMPRAVAKLRPWSSVVRNSGFAAVSWLDEDGRPHDEDGLGVVASANGDAAEALFAGAKRSLSSILDEADRAKGAPKGFALRTRARLVDHTKTEMISSPNVLGILPGSDPQLAAQYIVLSAHSDHIGISPPAKDDTPATDRINNGAMDNAAGVATLIEVARAAVTASDRPRRSLIFLASTGEEEGLLGADYYARHPGVPIASIVGDVDLDMPVLTYPFSDVIAYGADHSTIGATEADAGRTMGVSLSPDPEPDETVFVRSDHYMLVRQGVPAVFLATGEAGAGQAAWAEFNEKHYHRPSDDMNLPVQWDQGARFTDINYRITRALADADLPPMWKKGDFFGDLFAPDRPKTP
ncbi:M28 family metallopeptidase [Sphingomonas sp.]|uniref:M28 family metallopeptidase n=1 Tax=Sphingomonas sp. TaxID=28214 RepID=UPI003B3B724F